MSRTPRRADSALSPEQLQAERDARDRRCSTRAPDGTKVRPRSGSGSGRVPVCLTRNRLQDHSVQSATDAEVATYDRIIERGRIIRIETDGNGQLVEYDEGPAPVSKYGLGNDTMLEDRATIAWLEYERNENAMLPSERHEAVLAIVRSSAGIRARDIRARLTCYTTEVAASLISLRDRGLVYYNRADTNGLVLWHAVVS